MRRETKEAWPSVVSLTILFLHSLTPVHSVPSLVCCCTRSGWKRLDFDKDKTRQDRTRQDKTRQDKTRQDKTRHDTTRHATT
jgi:hypothetical protein